MEKQAKSTNNNSWRNIGGSKSAGKPHEESKISNS